MVIIERLIMHFMEGFFMIGAGLGVLGIRLKMPIMTAIACLYGLMTYSVRQFYIINKIPFGTHTFVLIACFVLLLMVLGKQTFFTSLSASLISLVLLIMADGVILAPALTYLRINPVTIATKPGGLLLAGLISNALLIVTFFITYVLKIQFASLVFEIKNKG
ncbi:hypothetical protein [Geosporobacter ferrireducens]|uniref:Uncharacterized protein n=1 Tax=Geosporobacter ferrireducens TaxID=1424294 RepID=A0A1D8GCI9_9FIRM|nr:hypothetical protein [Geosporobacter ferrireducens]AOT68621.1 hypothetical protein Gferi_02820 [Geosporobacter ferrireducens]MTI54092.1 hypothetical protein [Geosporobacter ferrireducens]